ncbi:MAG: lipopolysaccharide biosynthesis, partial [Bryobacterales bacterium]|nr:lipopolysaccharide biosynthesis [Bryobacterales bacterium]
MNQVNGSTATAAAPFKDVATYQNGAGGAARSFVYLEPLLDNSATGSSSELLDTWQLVRSRVWTILLVTLLGGTAGMLLTLVEKPTYQAKGALEIDAPVENALGFQGPVGVAYSPDSYLQTQVRLLQTRGLRSRVIAGMRKKGRLPSDPQTSHFRDLRAVFGLPAAAATESKFGTVPEFEIKVRAFDNSHMVEIQCDASNPQFAAEYVNTMAEEYIQAHMEARWDSQQRTSKWLGRQLEDLKRKLEDSEHQMQAYNASAGLLFTDEKDSVQGEKLKQIQGELSKAEADRVAKQSVYEVAKANAADSVPMVVDNERLSGYQTKLTELRRELAELSSQYLGEHYKVIRVKAQIAEVDAAFKRDRQAILNRIENEFRASQRRESLLLKQYQLQTGTVTANAAKAIDFDILKREVDTNRQLYGALLQKLKEASVASAISASNVRLADPAEPPSRPYKPNLASTTMKGLGAGLLLSLALILGGDRINRSLRAPGESQFHLKVPELGVIPSSDSMLVKRPGRQPPTLGIVAASTDGELSQDGKVELVTWQDSPSLIAESFRNTLASILLSGSKPSGPRVILVTSAGRDEGKSTTVSNLGIVLAEINQKILLFDADMRMPRLHHFFDCSNSWG